MGPNGTLCPGSGGGSLLFLNQGIRPSVNLGRSIGALYKVSLICHQVAVMGILQTTELLGYREMIEGFLHYPAFLDSDTQTAILREIEGALAAAPLYTPHMPRTGRPFSVRMTNLGELGWVSDRKGYRYQATHPETGRPWPTILPALLGIWRELSGYPHDPQACLVNYYREGARMGLHRDEDEEDFSAPVLSISLGDTAVFRLGGADRSAKTRAIKLASGDVIILGGPARLSYHGIDRVIPGSSNLVEGGGRINLTLRRVTKPRFRRRWRVPSPHRRAPASGTCCRSHSRPA
jgi:DNA oxidative demethylase